MPWPPWAKMDWGKKAAENWATEDDETPGMKFDWKLS